STASSTKLAERSTSPQRLASARPSPRGCRPPSTASTSKLLPPPVSRRRLLRTRISGRRSPPADAGGGGAATSADQRSSTERPPGPGSSYLSTIYRCPRLLGRGNVGGPGIA